MIKAIPYVKEAEKFTQENLPLLCFLYQSSTQGKHWRLLWKNSTLPPQIEIWTGQVGLIPGSRTSDQVTCKNLDDHLSTLPTSLFFESEEQLDLGTSYG